MTGWEHARSDHRALLMEFTCAPKESFQLGALYNERRRSSWAHQAQSLIRGASVPRKSPRMMIVLPSPEANRIDAAVAFHHEAFGEDQHRFHVDVLARHLDRTGEDLGKSALQAFLQECYTLIDDLPETVVRAVFTAEAHKANRQFQRLVKAEGWSPSDELLPDPNYELWELIMDLESAETPDATGEHEDQRAGAAVVGS